MTFTLAHEHSLEHRIWDSDTGLYRIILYEGKYRVGYKKFPASCNFTWRKNMRSDKLGGAVRLAEKHLQGRS